MELVTGARCPLHLAFVEGGLPIIIGVVFAKYFRDGILLVDIETQHAVHRQRVDYFMHVEDLIGVPTVLEVLHQSIDFISIEQLDKLAAKPSVAMLTAE